MPRQLVLFVFCLHLNWGHMVVNTGGAIWLDCCKCMVFVRRNFWTNGYVLHIPRLQLPIHHLHSLVTILMSCHVVLALEYTTGDEDLANPLGFFLFFWNPLDFYGKIGHLRGFNLLSSRGPIIDHIQIRGWNTKRFIQDVINFAIKTYLHQNIPQGSL